MFYQNCVQACDRVSFCFLLSMLNRHSCHSLPWLLGSSLIDFGVLEGKRSGATKKKDQRILGSKPVTDHKATAQEQVRTHIQQTQKFRKVSKDPKFS